MDANSVTRAAICSPSWAPRWRLLCMIEDGKNPFDGLDINHEQEDMSIQSKVMDNEIESVIDDFETSEE